MAGLGEEACQRACWSVMGGMRGYACKAYAVRRLLVLAGAGGLGGELWCTVRRAASMRIVIVNVAKANRWVRMNGLV